ncbi:polysaccharide export outer membrane protein [Muriicola jejuensis]|uniref:Polysaccharide export protein n=1 Tax=Muriicola jejuensis TaxID=504488 RepID=A0A6P0UE69_9FLAO|nr:polysaccharide biosynthesis/export family protein [Muriicola jejuensis]NER11515.1 polysaccharide export protein [Muriicola jejuensis]SMP20192.1 polysaccharide export outer membrane protein [Muriicola jejuensis]
MKRRLSNFVIVFIVALTVFSCASRKEIVYFQDTGNYETLIDENKSITKFKIDDLVSIYVSSLNPEASAPFNLFRGNSEGGFRAEQVDYLVDQDGMIDFPVIGKLKIEGLSPDELRNLLRTRLSEYLKDPIINIRLRNFTVTVLGQVTRPGTYPVNGEQITILEALGLAGDITLRGVRNNILVIRDFNGTKVYNRIDLTSKNMTKSPVYYLTQNDVVYVEPNSTGIRETSVGQSTSITIAILSTLITSAVILITRS